VFSVVVSSAAVAATCVRRVSDSPGVYFLYPLAATPLLLPTLMHTQFVVRVVIAKASDKLKFIGPHASLFLVSERCQK